jgi:hypothetical protein
VCVLGLIDAVHYEDAAYKFTQLEKDFAFCLVFHAYNVHFLAQITIIRAVDVSQVAELYSCSLVVLGLAISIANTSDLKM